MGNFKMRILTYFIVLTLTACGQSKVKIIADTYQDGKPKTVRYFNSKTDSREIIEIKHENGKGTVDKPLTFEEEGYYENGKLQFKGQYFNGQTSGCWEYYYETGLKEAKSYYNNGKTTDTVFCWSPSGKLKRNFVEIDTAKNYWHCVDYFENGQKSIETYLFKDEFDKWIIEGKWLEWYQYGQLKLEATMKNNSSVGKWTEWDEKGTVKEISEKPFTITF